MCLELKITLKDKYFYFYHHDKLIAKVKDKVVIDASVYHTPMQLKREKFKLIQENPKAHELSENEPCKIRETLLF